MSTAFALDLPEALEGPRLRLRAPRGVDVAALSEAALESVETVGRWASWVHRDYRLEDAVAWITDSREARECADGFEYLIFDEEDRLVGGCGLSHVNRAHRYANLGYWIRASAEGRGFASEAARTLAVAGLLGGLARVEIVVDLRNLASQRVAEKIGAKREGILRHRVHLRGEALDAAGYSLIASDID